MFRVQFCFFGVPDVAFHSEEFTTRSEAMTLVTLLENSDGVYPSALEEFREGRWEVV